MKKTVAFDEVLTKLLVGKSLTELESLQIFSKLFSEELTYQQAKALLLLLARKGETFPELLGCVKAIRALEPPLNVSIPHLMDTCGTGGDQSHSCNISTMAALVIAGAGGKVAKHGNRAISSKSGSSDLLESLGVRLDAPRARMIAAIKKCGIGYFHAPFYHPVFMKVQTLRRTLKTRTIFNWVGPLLNPLKIKAQLVGVARKEHLGIYAEILRRMGMAQAMVCHSRDGMDELSTAARNDVAEISRGKIRYRLLSAQKLGFPRAAKKEFQGGFVEQNRKIALRILQGRLRGPIRDIVVLNAAAGLYVSGISASIEAGIERAQESIDSKAAYRALQELKRISRQA